jgi:hypothetical protein
VELLDSTYERGSGFFELMGDNVTVNNVTVRNIGNLNILDLPMWAKFRNDLQFDGAYSLIRINSYYSVFAYPLDSEVV